MMRTPSSILKRFLLLLVVAAVLVGPPCKIWGIPGSEVQGTAGISPSFSAVCSAAERAAAKNVILFIGDGMGPGQVDAGRLIKGGRLAMASMPVRTSVTTLSWGDNITDSAAAGTALATGHKTVNGSLAVLPDGTPVRTILEAAREAGWRVGLVTTCAITDATPAAFAVHVESRSETRAIAAALIAARVDLLMGGGAANFLPTLFSKDKPPIEVARETGYAVVRDRGELAGISSLPLLGLFAMVDMDYDKVRDSGRQPSLAEMTAKAVELLSSDGRGFLLVVEGGRIDHACHKNDADALLGEMAAFDDAVACALEFARRRRDASGNPDTLVVVTADHETGRLRVTADGKLEFGTDGHTDIKVPLFAEGPGQELFARPLDNTDVPKVIAAAAGVAPKPETKLEAGTEMETKSGPGVVTGAEEGPAREPGRRFRAPVRLTVMTYNIHIGIGADLKLDLDRIADLIKAQGADIVGLCEVDQGMKRSGQVDQARYIAERLGYSYVYGPSYMYDGGAYGNALLSRYPIISSKSYPLPNIRLNEPRGLLEAQIDVDGSTLNVFVTHLDVEYADSRLAQARAVIEISSKAGGPKIVMGDFNASPTGTPEIAAMLRYFNDTQQVYRVLVDSDELVKEGLFARDYLKGGYTYDSYDPARRIDYIFTSFDIKVVGDAGAARTPRTLASDHLPYVATIELPSEAGIGLPRDSREPGGETPVVAVFVSGANEAWYNDMRWDYEDDMDALFELVREMGLECVRVSEEDLALLPRLAADRPSLLILSNARRMSPAQAQSVRDFVASGGRLLATAQTSLKTADELPGGFHGFQLADLLGVSFVGWQGVAPLHGAIAPVIAIPQAGPTTHKDTLPPSDAGRASGVATPVAASATTFTLTSAPEPALVGRETEPASQKDALAPGAAPMPVSTPSPSPAPAPGDSNPRSAAMSHFLWSGAAAPLRLPKPQAVLVRCLPGAVVLGKWADSSGEATHPDTVNAAVVLRGSALYISADVLSRDMLSDEAVRSFAEKVIRCLLAL